MGAEVAITGYSSISALGKLNEEFLNNFMKEKYHEIETNNGMVARTVDNFNFKEYKTAYSYNKLDSINKYALVACREALDMAGLTETVKDMRNGVIFATSYCGESLVWNNSEIIKKRGKRYVSPFKWAAGMQSTLSILCREFSIQGYNCCVNEDIVSSLSAIRVAYDLIKSNQVDVMIVAGGDPLDDTMMELYQKAGVMKPYKSKELAIYNKNENNVTFGEACGVLILENKEKALQRNANILAEIKGVSCSVRSSEKEEENIVYEACDELLKSCNTTVNDINFICSGANGDEACDAVEERGYQKLNEECDHNILVATNKSYTGETVGSAGILSIIHALQAYETNELHCVHKWNDGKVLNSAYYIASRIFQNSIVCGVGNLGICYAVMVKR